MSTEDKRQEEATKSLCGKKPKRRISAGFACALAFGYFLRMELVCFMTDEPAFWIRLLEMKVSVNGVFIREETDIKAPRDGIIIPKVDSIERVPNRYEFAMLIDETSRITLQKINELEEDIIRQVAESYPGSLDQHSEFREQVKNEADKLSVLAQQQDSAGAEGNKINPRAAVVPKETGKCSRDRKTGFICRMKRKSLKN